MLVGLFVIGWCRRDDERSRLMAPIDKAHNRALLDEWGCGFLT